MRDIVVPFLMNGDSAMLIDELPTPAILVEQSRLEANLLHMQQKADREGVALRPHVKTHRSTRLAARQIERGAHGITVAKPSEAVVFADAGFSDIRIAYSLAAPHHFEAVGSLLDRARVSFCLDTPAAANAASSLFYGLGATVDILVEIDPGYGRCGVPWDDADLVATVREISSQPGLRLAGILTHAGQAYSGPLDDSEDAETHLRRVSAEEVDRMLEVAQRLQDGGIVTARPGALEISVGSTPGMRHFSNKTEGGFRITEVRPGNYVFNDAIQIGLTAARTDECALTVLATVVSKHRDRHGRSRLFIDAGRKILTSDTGYGTKGYGVILHSAHTMKPLPHATIDKLSEEHGWVRVPGGSTLEVGDRVRIVPNHACVVVSTQDRLFVVDDTEVLETWKIEARGCSQ